MIAPELNGSMFHNVNIAITIKTISSSSLVVGVNTTLRNNRIAELVYT